MVTHSTMYYIGLDVIIRNNPKIGGEVLALCIALAAGFFNILGCIIFFMLGFKRNSDTYFATAGIMLCSGLTYIFGIIIWLILKHEY